MFVVSDDKKRIINVGEVIMFMHHDNREISAVSQYDNWYTIGSYETPQETENKFNALLEFLKNGYGQDTFYM